MFWQQLNLLKVTVLSLLLAVAWFTFDVKAAWAHYPHDDIFAVKLSPDYQQDRTLFINVRRILFKSEDGGKSWQRIVRGLDHQHELASLDIAPNSPKILFLSTLGDGIYKSETEGDSWFKVNQGLNDLNIDLVAIAPDLANLVLAAGTKSGLYQTENGGVSWQVVMTEERITSIAFTPQQSQQVIIGDRQGKLYSSDNGGRSWRQLATLDNSGEIKSIAISPNYGSDRTFWVGTQQGGIFQTVDGGGTFAPVNNGIGDRAIMSLAISADYERDSTLLASIWDEGVFRSTDGGASWQKSSKGLTKDKQAELSNFNRPHFSDLSISPTYSQDGTVFVAGFDGLFKSTDWGRVWRELDTLSSNIIIGMGISPDYQQDSTLAVTTYLGGAYISHDRGANWESINRGLEKDKFLKRTAKQLLQGNFVARLFDVVFSPDYSNDQTIFSPSWTYFLKSSDRGQHWQRSSLKKLPEPLNRPTKYSIAVSPNFASDKTIYLGSMQGNGKDAILKSTDGGQNFSVVGNVDHRMILYLAISPDFATDRTLYAGVRDLVYKSEDGGQTWQPASNGIPSTQEAIKLAISPSYQVDQTVFAGTAKGLFATRDGGKSWSKLGGTADGDDGYVEAVAISPDYLSDRTAIVNFRGKGLFKTVDRGTSFTRVGNALTKDNHSLANMYAFWPPTIPIQFSPSYSSDRTIYGVSDTELFRSADGGDTWVNLPLPAPQGTNLMQFVTYHYHRLSVAPMVKFLLAAIVALLSYLILKGLRLEKRLPSTKIPLKTSGAFAAFIVAFIFLNV